RPPRFFLLSGSESTAEDAEDAEEKRECERATHYHPTTQLDHSPVTLATRGCQHIVVWFTVILRAEFSS
ncbi:MAG TPA: hypothetical protein VN937_07125, partial [Blastocatellia bacterium]|nr:hypothetical protein [Blastocatellia bacterium]